MNELCEYISEKKPHITDSSINAYSSNIISLFRKMKQDFKIQPPVATLISFFSKNTNEVLTFLAKNYVPSRRKTILSSIMTLVTDKKNVYDKYQKQMMLDRKTYDAENREQTKTESQKQNWLSQKQIDDIFKDYHKKYFALFKKPELTKLERHHLINMMILSLYVLTPPRRLQDYALMKVKNINKDVDNYIDPELGFVFQQYKTSKKYGTQIVKIPTKLKLILDKWNKINTSDYLIPNHKYPDRPLTVSALHTRLNNIFDGKNISVNLLRHIYITDEVLPNLPKLTVLDRVARDMGNSVDTQMLYKKF
jgi:hypothetical protein